MDAIQQTLLAYPEGPRYLGLCGMVFLASIGLFPAATLDMILFVVGVFVSKEIFKLVPALGIATFMVFLGETLVFELGQHFGSRVFDLGIIRRQFKPEKVALLKERLQKSQRKVIRSIRFVPALRPYVLLCTSSLGLKRRSFYSYNSILISLHVVIFVCGTWLLTRFITPTPPMIAGVMLLIWTVNWFTR